MNSPGNARLPYYSGIDGLRAVAVLSVLICHLDRGWLPGGYIGVDIFFVISGFVVTASVGNLKPTSIREMLAIFYARRILRIAPALTVCLLLTTIASVLFIPPAWLSDTNYKTGVAAFFGVSNFLLAATSNDYFSPRTEFNPFTHTWSLGVEEQFYVLFPFLYYFWARPQARGRAQAAVISALVVLSTASLVCCAYWTRTHIDAAFYLIPARLWELGVGVLLCLSRPWWSARLAQGPSLLGAFASLICALALCVGFIWTDATQFPFPWALVPAFATAGLIAIVVARPGDVGARILSAPLPRGVGKISYSLYLWHWPVLVLLRWTIGLEPLWVKCLAVVAAFALAIASYRFVETPMRSLARIKAIPRGRVVAGGLLAILALATAAAAVAKSERFVSLSVTRNHAVWYPDPDPSSIRGAPCQVQQHQESVGSVTVDLFEPIGCPKVAGRLLVGGDSHAGAYAALLLGFASRTGMSVRMYSKGGCVLFSLIRPNGQGNTPCASFVREVVAQFNALGEPGDVLFLPSLRMPRFKDQWGGISSRAAPLPPEEIARMREAAIAEVAEDLRPFTQRGGRVVFEAPTPMFKAPPFRCADWFNESNAVCQDGFSVSREELEARRAPALASMHAIEIALPGTTLWDPLPILCPSNPCNAFASGKPLFFDGDHLSGYGDKVLLEPFTRSMLQLAKPAS